MNEAADALTQADDVNNALLEAICRAEVLADLGDVDSAESQPTRSSGLPRSDHSAWRLPAFAARGLKNSEIAENLFLSIETWCRTCGTPA